MKMTTTMMMSCASIFAEERCVVCLFLPLSAFDFARVLWPWIGLEEEEEGEVEGKVKRKNRVCFAAFAWFCPCFAISC